MDVKHWLQPLSPGAVKERLIAGLDYSLLGIGAGGILEDPLWLDPGRLAGGQGGMRGDGFSGSHTVASGEGSG